MYNWNRWSGLGYSCLPLSHKLLNASNTRILNTTRAKSHVHNHGSAPILCGRRVMSLPLPLLKNEETSTSTNFERCRYSKNTGPGLVHKRYMWQAFFDPLSSLPTPSILVHAIFVDLVRNAVLSSFDFRLVKFGAPSCRVARIGVCKQSLAKSLSLEFGHSQLISAGHFFDS